MKRLNTIRIRFALWTAGLLLVTLTLFGFFVYTRMSRSLANAVDDALRTAASQVVAEVDVEDGIIASVDDVIQDMPNMPLLEHGFSLRVFNSAGQMLQEYGPYQALPLLQENVTSTDPSETFISFTDAATQHPVRVYTSPIVEQDQQVGTLQVAQNVIKAEQTLSQLLTALLVGVPLLVVVAGIGGYVLAASALAPIDKITRTARQISADDLSARLNLSVADDEVARLADTFDSMLARLERAFRRERQFTANASHELRTPLTTMQTILDGTLARQRTRAEYEQALADLFEVTHHMQHLIEGLLHLAHSDNATNLAKRQPVNLSILLNDVAETLRPLAADKGLELTTSLPDDLVVTGDGDSLIRLFVNLLGNAVKFTEQGRITVRAGLQPDDLVQVTISDTGVGIAPEHLPFIFDRFHRVDNSRSTEGAGLGLAIALNAAQVHGGSIETTSMIGTGTTFTVTLATG